MTASSPNPRILQLDVLRAIAIFLVLGRHMPRPAADAHWLITSIDEYWRRAGWIGVDLFFVLSGFLVSGLLFREYQKRKRLDLPRFLVRRGFKIYPAFYVMLAFTILFFSEPLLATAKDPHNAFWRNTIGEVLFIQNYYDSWWSHTWSLAVEEHFYLLIALLLWQLAKVSKTATPTADDAPSDNPFKALPNFFFGVAALCLVMRFWNALDFKYKHTTHLFYTHLRADSLFFGVFLSYLSHFHADGMKRFMRWAYYPLLVVGLAMVSPSLFLEVNESFFMHTIGLTCLYLGFGALLLVTLNTQRFPTGPVMRALAYVGFHSYSIYLWHLVAQHLAREDLAVLWQRHYKTPFPFMYKVAVYLIGSLVIGIVAAKLVEVPVLRLRDRFFPSRDKPAEPKAEPAPAPAAMVAP